MSDSTIKMQIEDCLTRFARSVQVCRLYERDHPLVKEALDGLHSTLVRIFWVKEEFTVGIVGNELAYDKEPLYEWSERRKGFIGYLKALGMKKISILRGCEKNELTEFITTLAGGSGQGDQAQAIRDRIAASTWPHIITGDIGIEPKRKPVPIPRENFKELLKQNYQNSVDFLTQTFENLKGNQSLNVQSARQIVEGLIKNLLQNKNLLLILTSLKGHDENTFMHGVNVSVFTLLQAEVLGLEEKYMVEMGMAAMLHDVGKLSLPTAILKEMENSLLEETSRAREQQQFDQDISGAKILLETEGISPLAAIAAFEHNIRYDMTGPSRKIYGKKLNMVSMMITISDYYDRIRRRPSYYETGGPEKAYEEMMKLSGKLFHPDLLQNFFSSIGIFSPGTLVELDTKEIGMVIQASMLDIRRPQVEILYDASGERYKEPFIVNLIEKDRRGQYKRSIVKSISPFDKFKVPDKYQ